jgi:hypothetical protein
MTVGNEMFASATGPPIMLCPSCYPQRPMVIKTVAMSLLGRSRKVVFECTLCGASVETTPTFARDPAASPRED